MAKYFSCSPHEIEKLKIDEFNDYLELMKADNAIQQKNNIQNRG